MRRTAIRPPIFFPKHGATTRDGCALLSVEPDGGRRAMPKAKPDLYKSGPTARLSVMSVSLSAWS